MDSDKSGNNKRRYYSHSQNRRNGRKKRQSREGRYGEEDNNSSREPIRSQPRSAGAMNHNVTGSLQSTAEQDIEQQGAYAIRGDRAVRRGMLGQQRIEDLSVASPPDTASIASSRQQTILVKAELAEPNEDVLQAQRHAQNLQAQIDILQAHIRELQPSSQQVQGNVNIGHQPILVQAQPTADLEQQVQSLRAELEQLRQGSQEEADQVQPAISEDRQGQRTINIADTQSPIADNDSGHQEAAKKKWHFRILPGILLLVMVGSVAVAVGVSLANRSSGDSGGEVVKTPTTPAPTFAPPPTNSPETTPAPTPVTTPAPTPMTNTPGPTGTPAPTTAAPTPDPTQQPEDGTAISTFYVLAGRFSGTNLEDLPDRLATLPNDNGSEFLVHLGDWNSPFATGCDEESYQNVADLYNTSSVPVYFVVGDNEFNDCPDPEAAIGFWYDYLLDYETAHWPEPVFNVNRQTSEGYPENFAFLFNGVLFVGINLVGGEVKDLDEWVRRFAFDQKWIDDNVAAFPNAQTLIVFGHADPDIEATNPFFNSFYEGVKDYNMNVKYIHRNLGVETAHSETVAGVDNLELLVVEGQVWPPMRVRINAVGTIFEFDQENWYEDGVGRI